MMTRNMLKKTVVTSCLLIASCAGVSNYQPEATASAKTIFDQACARCHGNSEALETGIGFKIEQAHQSLDFITQKIAKGGTTMPVFSLFSTEDRFKLARYLLAHQ